MNAVIPTVKKPVFLKFPYHVFEIQATIEFTTSTYRSHRGEFELRLVLARIHTWCLRRVCGARRPAHGSRLADTMVCCCCFFRLRLLRWRRGAQGRA